MAKRGSTVEPSDDALVDWAALVRVGDEAGELHAAGKLDREAFRRLWAEGVKAVGTETGLLETLIMLGDRAWVPRDE